MKLKISCLLSVCLLMGSCSGGTSGNVSDSGTSASPSISAFSSPTNMSSTSNANRSNPDTEARANQLIKAIDNGLLDNAIKTSQCNKDVCYP